MHDDNCQIIAPEVLLFEYTRPMRRLYDVHPDDPGFDEELAYTTPLWDYDPYEVCTAAFEWSGNDELQDAQYDFYRDAVIRCIVRDAQERRDIAVQLALEDRYRCEKVQFSFQLPSNMKVEFDPYMTFSTVMEEILMSRPETTQTTIARSIHVSPSMMSRWMTDQYMPDMRQAMLLCMYLGLSSAEGLALIQTIEAWPRSTNIVESLFKALLYNNAFSNKDRHRLRYRDLVSDIHQMLSYAVGYASISGREDELENVRCYFYDQNNEATKNFILPNRLFEEARNNPKCEIVSKKITDYGHVHAVVFGKKERQKIRIK